MNTIRAIQSDEKTVALSAAFNYDASCFAVGLPNGFCVFSSEPCQMTASKDFNGGIGAAQMLGKSNYIALVGGGKQPKFPQNKVIIWDDAKQKAVIQIPVLTAVRGVRISRSHIVVALQNYVRMYKFLSPAELCGNFETADNPLGLCCLTLKTLVFPGMTPGQVQMVDIATMNVSIIPAHASALRAIDISRDGEVLATASETGTLIRVFSTSNCARIAELRRGVDHATIYSLSIAPSGQLLAVTSDKSTLHIFDIPHPTKPAKSNANNGHRRLTSMGSGTGSPVSDGDTKQKWGILGRIPLLPRVFSDVYSFASAHFEMGDEALYGASTPLGSESAFRPPKGIIGWTNDHTIIVLGAGRDGRWEKFIIAEGEDGRRYCVRDGWKRYLGPS